MEFQDTYDHDIIIDYSSIPDHMYLCIRRDNSLIAFDRTMARKLAEILMTFGTEGTLPLPAVKPLMHAYL